MAQKEGGNTTGYLDLVDVPPVINSGPRRLDKGNEGDDDRTRRETVPLTDLFVSATNGLGNESKVKGNAVQVEDVLVERVSVMTT
jgi:hypothetical protein